MARAQTWLGGAIGLVGTVLAVRWAMHDRPIDAPAARPARPEPRVAAPRTGAGTARLDVAGLAVEIVDGRTGAPWPDAALAIGAAASVGPTLAQAAGPGLARYPAVAVTGPSLLAVLGGVDWTIGPSPPPLVTVRAVPLAALPEPHAVPAAPTGAGRVVGVVTQDGARVADVAVTLWFLGDVGPGRPVTRDRIPQPLPVATRRFIGTAGVIAFDQLAPGSYAAVVVAPGRGAAVARATVVDDLAGDLSIALGPAATVAGVVVDERHAPVAGATVIVRAGDLPLAEVTSDATGAYAAPDLPAVAVDVAGRHPACIGDHRALGLPAGQLAHAPLGLLCAQPADAPPAP
ncbi:MAG: carboxypeptidase-like regulatory domain-containing protein [Kofleriaceae bacterium]